MDESIVGQPRILLVDADPARAAMRCSQLTRHGWHVTDAGAPREALRVVARRPFDLVLLYLPPATTAAVDLPGEIRRAAGGSFLPLIIVSDAATTEADRCRCLDNGADDILPESVGSDELWARMNALLRIKDLQDDLDDSRNALQDALRREDELISKLQADNDRLKRQVVTDPLTRLHNVRYFQTFIVDEFRIARRYGQAMSLLMLDLDHFKMVNDRYGHPMGDFVLKEASVILRNSGRDSDVVARTGGEEFAVILPRAGRDHAAQLAERIRSTLESNLFVNGPTQLTITCSIGLACYPADADVTSPDHLIYFADQALLAAKQAGRNRTVHWRQLDDAVKCRLRTHVQVAAEEPQPADGPTMRTL